MCTAHTTPYSTESGLTGSGTTAVPSCLAGLRRANGSAMLIAFGHWARAPRSAAASVLHAFLSAILRAFANGTPCSAAGGLQPAAEHQRGRGLDAPLSSSPPCPRLRTLGAACLPSTTPALPCIHTICRLYLACSHEHSSCITLSTALLREVSVCQRNMWRTAIKFRRISSTLAGGIACTSRSTRFGSADTSRSV